MHDPKFENEVQQRMEELEFSPSEAVWVNLQRGLHKEKRRRAPLLWLFFLLGGMMLGAGGASLFYFNRPSSSQRLTAAGSPDATKTAIATGSPVTAKTTAARRRSTMAEDKDMTVSRFATGAAGINKPAVRRMTALETPGRDKTGQRQTEWLNGSPAKGGFAKTIAVTPLPGLLHPETDWDITSRLSRIQLSSTTKALSARDLSSSAKNSPISPVAAIANKRGAKKVSLSHTPSWEAGFAGGGGLSSAALSAAPAVKSTTTFLTTPNLSLASSLQLSGAPAGRLQLRFSKIQPDVSFWAGIFVQRPILKKLSLTFGLNLHYYSTWLETSEKAPDSVNTSRPSLFYPTTAYAAPLAQSTPYYASQDYKYSNHYYFLEIPIALQWQFNRNRKTPLFWEGGLSYSRLISANALYYNEKSGVYYKDGGAASPNHLMAFSSIMIGLSWRGNLIRLGPEGQYGLTSLVSANNASSQHLFYGGLKITVVPRRW